MSYTVLIVDDSSIIRSVVRKSLSMMGLDIGRIHEASNGLEALEVLSKEWIDIVLADLNMPKMTGMELVEKMSQDSVLTTTPVVIISSEQSETRIEGLMKKGVRAYIKKPFRPEGLKAVIEKLLGPQKRSGS